MPPPELLSAIRAVASGDAVVAPSVTRRLLDAFLPHLPHLPDLGSEPGTGAPPEVKTPTSREREILTEVAAGLSNAEIAARLVLAEATVKPTSAGCSASSTCAIVSRPSCIPTSTVWSVRARALTG